MYKYTTEELEQAYNNEIEVISHDEWQSWVNHPCGRALKLKLILDQTGHFEEWINDQEDADLCKWLIRRNELLLITIYKDGIYNRGDDDEN